jgi:hypothetical protein
MREPGTYVVVSNPSSFSSLPEYSEEYSGNPSTTLGMDNCSDLFHKATTGSVHNIPTTGDPGDPNVVILRIFEEPLRRASITSIAAVHNNSTSKTSQRNNSVVISHPAVQSYHMMSLIEAARNGGRDAGLLLHYRTSISQHIIKVGSQDVDEDLFEIHARSYPPVRLIEHNFTIGQN